MAFVGAWHLASTWTPHRLKTKKAGRSPVFCGSSPRRELVYPCILNVSLQTLFSPDLVISEHLGTLEWFNSSFILKS